MAASAKDVLKATGCKPNTRLLKGTHKKVSPVAIVVKYLQIFVEGQGEEGDGEGQRETRGDSGLVCTHARAHRLCVCLAHKATKLSCTAPQWRGYSIRRNTHAQVPLV